MNNNVHHGQRHDIPLDVWEILLETIREMKALSPTRQGNTKDGDAA